MLATSIFSFSHNVFLPIPKAISVLTLSQTINFILKEFADNNLKFDENGRKFLTQVENTVEKGEIARYEQFLLFPHSVFKRLVLQTRENQGLFGERVMLHLFCRLQMLSI